MYKARVQPKCEIHSEKGITKNGNLLFTALHIDHHQIFFCRLQLPFLDSDVIPCSFWLRHHAPTSKDFALQTSNLLVIHETEYLSFCQTSVSLPFSSNSPIHATELKRIMKIDIKLKIHETCWSHPPNYSVFWLLFHVKPYFFKRYEHKCTCNAQVWVCASSIPKEPHLNADWYTHAPSYYEH